MKNIYLFLVTLFYSVSAFSQADLQDFGKIDKSDLEMKECSFDKEADAMVLFEKGSLYFSDRLDVYLILHKRIKVFNENGKDEANIRIPYYSGDNTEDISSISAQTISLNEKGESVIQKLEKKLIYVEKVTENISAIVFSFPNVQPGSVIEYKYTLKTDFMNIPDWYFQSDLPTRYSYLKQEIVEIFDYTAQITRNYPMALDKSQQKSKSFFFGGSSPSTMIVMERELAVKNIPALRDEPYMTADKNYLQRVTYQLNRVKKFPAGWENYLNTWEKLAEKLLESEQYGLQIRKNISDTEDFIKKAKAITNLELRAASVYDFVRKNMKWNGSDTRGSTEVFSKSWQKHTGTSGEINLILLNLLKKADVPAKPLLVSTRDHGEVNKNYPFLDQFNKTVAYVPLDSSRYLVLDATEKHLPHNLIAYDILNTQGFVIQKGAPAWVNLVETTPNRLGISFICDINKDGTLSGEANIYSANYGRTSRVSRFINDGEEKYKEFLKDGNSNLSIIKLVTSNADVDTLSFIQNVNFKLQNASEESNYIYFNPNLFLGLSNNPFIKEKRVTDVDFGYLRSYNLTGNFKIPEGFTVDELPKSVTMIMPDESIVMRRIVQAEGQNISYRFILTFKKAVYKAEEYDMLFELYKKLYSTLSEQVVLKKI
ncbi:DUF3857 domain-containing protein [Daejeonella oryzae]|uniref:DUF3857 domain-containing protein n=1 Tax=Daejeonella oryzae TaxID=1122943 RepID=UPI00040C2A45|nr:DUF3857 domain-containing protein [Daejeonella oryzae]